MLTFIIGAWVGSIISFIVYAILNVAHKDD